MFVALLRFRALVRVGSLGSFESINLWEVEVKPIVKYLFLHIHENSLKSHCLQGALNPSYEIYYEGPLDYSFLKSYIQKGLILI